MTTLRSPDPMQNSSCRQTVSVDLENGLHLVPCSMIAKLAQGFECDIQVVNGDLAVDGKDILALMGLNAVQGTSLVLAADGKNATRAIQELVQLFETGFVEEESSQE